MIGLELKDDFFKKVEKKTKVDKNTIVDLAKKLQAGNMTNKNVTKEQEEKIIQTIVNDKVPKNIDKMF